MRARSLVLLLLACTFPLVWAEGELAASRFPEAVRYLLEREVFTGYDDGSLRLRASVTRGELAALVLRALGDAPDARACFEDVSPESWYAPAVCALHARGLMVGDNGRFEPERRVSYAEAAKVVVLALDLPISRTLGDPWYGPYIASARASGLPVTSDPTVAISREFLAEMLYRGLTGRRSSPAPALLSPSDAVLSPGCGQPSPASPPGTLQVQGQTRHFLAVVPSSYQSNVPHHLVVAFHGRTNDNARVRRYFDLERGTHPTIYLYPQGLRQGSGFSWADPGDPPGALRDYAFFDALLEHVEQRYCLALDKVFVVGHSLGAYFATSLACARGERIRAVAALGGGVLASECRGEVAAMILHNPNDPLVPISEGRAARDLFLHRNGPKPPPIPSEPTSLGCVRHGAASDPYPVVWCPHQQDHSYGGRFDPHHWPRETGRAMIAFFESLP
jgi:polyhydroxybutyrate depolymerase